MSKSSIADDYQVLSDIEHILLKPNMYIGSAQVVSEDIYIVNDENQIRKKTIDYIPGLQRLYEEILLNAFDQTVREGTGCTEIHVNIDKETNTITVHNNGQGLPIVKKKELNCYIPEMVFGMLRSGSNYSDEERITGGTNGLGAKLANIFSILFRIETGDSNEKKLYIQEWTNQMTEKTDPVITSLGRKKPYTTITFQPDLKYFKIKKLSDDMIGLMKKRLIDIGFASHSKIKTFYNDKEITIKRTEDYMKLYCSDENQYESFIVDTSCERWTVGIMLSSNGFMHASFVNGIHTAQGGTHIDNVMKSISDEVITKLKSKKIEVKPSDVKNKLCLFLKSTIINPNFNSQTKEQLSMAKSKFGSEYIMSEPFKRKLLNSDLIKLLMNVSENKLIKDLSKTSGTKTNRLIGIKGLEDANWAGTSKSNETKLILTEGLSAKTFAMSAITVIGRDRFGIFPLKGKPLNVRDIAISKVSANAEICNIVKILGLKYGEKYTDISSLRYGGVISLNDADVDGSHILGLILNLFHYFWPELLAMGYLSLCGTPIVRVSQGKEIFTFYTLNEYDRWLEMNTKQFKTKYFKGLGTSTAAEARDALENIDQKIITFNSDELANNTINLAFDKKLTNNRKLWLMNDYNAKDNIDRSQREVNVSDYINKELIHFSYYDNQRSIPNIMDGLKPSQRKILHTAIKYLTNNEMKVAQFGAKVAEKTDYHHGEASLMGAIVGMAQNYMGSNNINLLEPLGAFGSRIALGSDAASPRYIFTQLSTIAKKIFDPKDSQLLNYLESDGMEIEPEWFAPVIPMILINGCLGIGSGFSSNVLKYNPLDICKYLSSLLNDKKPVKLLKPWYRGFNGTVERLDSGKYRTIGCYNFNDSKRSLIITELPVGVSTDDYKEFIEAMFANKDDSTISDIRYGNSDVIIYIEIIINAKNYGTIRELDPNELIDKFKLSSKISCTNMYLFNHKGIITKYNNVYEILKEFYEIRLDLYIKRRDAIIAVLKYELMILANKVKFIQHVKTNKLKLQNISDNSLLTYLIDNKFDQNNGVYGKPLVEPTLKEYSYLIDIAIRFITNENAKKFQQQMDTKQQELENIINITAKDMWKSDLQDILEINEITNNKLIEANTSSAPVKSSKAKRTTKKNN